MRAIEIEIAKREALFPVCSYTYKVFPKTDEAKVNFSLFKKDKGPMEKNVFELVKKYFKAEEPAFQGTASFFYDEQDQSKRIAEVKSIAMWQMAEQWVPGISHPNSNKKTFYKTLTEGEDFVIEVGEKIVHDQPTPLTFEDIKAL
ncbi:hypothetical protein ACQCVH_22110 [Bacillus infantis]|uniref:hypothetical protein n=1 Tax=Bacillus infantis TaxID=324767 RepID=UPI003CF470C9